MVANVLVLDNGSKYTPELIRVLNHLDANVKVERPPTITNPNSYQALVVGGGQNRIGDPNFEKWYTEFLKRIEVPTLCICRGYMELIRSDGGLVSTRQKWLTSIYSIFLDNFNLLPNIQEFLTFRNHKNNIEYSGNNLRVCGWSKVLKYEIVQHKEKPIVGLMAHIDHAAYEELINKEDGYNLLIFQNFINLSIR